ncbi:MAG: ATP-binding protein [Chloroflexota bacterium]
MKLKIEGDILIVGQENQSANDLWMWLRQRQFQSRFTNPGQETLQALGKKPPAIMIVDVTLSESEGFQTLSYMTKHHPHIPVIAMTHETDMVTMRRSFQLGASDLIIESFDSVLFLETLARMVEKARLNRYERLNRQISNAVSGTLALGSMMERVLLLAKEGVYAENGSLLILDDEGWVIRHLILVDQGREVHTRQDRLSQIMEKGFGGWLYREQQSALIDNTSLDDRWLDFPDRPTESRSVLGVPFISRNQVQGVLILIHGQSEQFDQQDLQFLESIALPAAMAIENARLFEREQQKSQEMFALYQTGLSIASALDYQAATKTIVQQIAATIGADSCAISHWDKSENRLTTLMSLILSGNQWQESQKMGDFLVVGDYPILQGPLFQQKISTRYLSDSAISQEEKVWMMERQIWATMIYPLIVRGETTGVITLAYREPGKLFTPRDKRLMTGVIAQVAIALENARLFEQVKAQTEWLTSQARELEDERRKLAAILQSTTDIAIAIDNQGLILLANLAFEQSFGIDALSILNQPYQQTLKGTKLRPLFERVQVEQTTLNLEVEAKSGRTYYANVTPVPNVGYVALLRDISHLKELDKMRTEVLSTASHDLKNPLTAIQGFTLLLMESEGLNTEQKELVEYISKMSKRMFSLTGDLLDLAQLEAGLSLQQQSCNINSLVETIVLEMKKQASLKQIQLETQLWPNIPTITCDIARMEQVLSNLLSNAIKYTPDSGTVIVRTATQQITEEQKTIKRLLIVVEDNGHGIDEDHIPHLFERFYRAQSPTILGIEGTGLGLAIVKTIVEQHGGQIWVESVVDQGSKFFVALPLSG